jgi:MoaA/NifB/PqqE/SkfB family radical SAM enzyme
MTMPLKELYPTFVLPAPNGCNLGCPFCVIAQRKEAVDTKLTDADYLWFLIDILVEFKINKMSIQGFEPLLPETWPLTKKLLNLAAALGSWTSVITNGIYLKDYAHELDGYLGVVDTLTVSLDSYDPAIHDNLRRVSGAFASAIEGIKALRPKFHGSLQVNSVLLPGKASNLEHMPELLVELGIKQWAISPYISIDNRSYVPHGQQVRTDLQRLIEKAERLGIVMFLSDEMRQLQSNDLFEGFYMKTLSPDAEIFRLSPDGSCSRGVEVLGTAQSAPIWDAKEVPAAFIERIFANSGAALERRSILGRRLAAWRANRILDNLELERR